MTILNLAVKDLNGIVFDLANNRRFSMYNRKKGYLMETITFNN